jgi:hypothetical protein
MNYLRKKLRVPRNRLKPFFRLLTILLSARLRNHGVPRSEAPLLARRAIRLLVTAAIGEGVISVFLEEIHPTGDSSVEAGTWIVELMISTLPKKP